MTIAAAPVVVVTANWVVGGCEYDVVADETDPALVAGAGDFGTDGVMQARNHATRPRRPRTRSTRATRVSPRRARLARRSQTAPPAARTRDKYSGSAMASSEPREEREGAGRNGGGRCPEENDRPYPAPSPSDRAIEERLGQATQRVTRRPGTTITLRTVAPSELGDLRIRACGAFVLGLVGTGRHVMPPNRLAVDLHRDLDHVVDRQTGSAVGNISSVSVSL